MPDPAGKRGAQSDPGEDGEKRGQRGDPLDTPPPLRRERPPRLHAREREREPEDGRAEPEHDEPEDPAVVDANRVRLRVLRDPRQSQCNAERAGTGDGGEGRGDETLDAVPVEHDPSCRRCDRERDAEAGVGQQQRDHGREQQERTGGPDGRPPPARRSKPQRDRHGDVGEERELVPVADRRAQPRHAPVVAVERGHALGQQRPAEHEPEQHRGRLRDRLSGTRQDRGEQHAEERERGVDERAVRVAPGAVGRERPERGQAHPDGEAEETAEEHAGRQIESGSRREPHRRRPCGHGGEPERKRADPNQRCIGEAAAEEERAERGHGAGRGDREAEASDRFRRSGHRR